MDYVAIIFVLLAAAIVGELRYRSLSKLTAYCKQCLSQCACMMTKKKW